jgi:hypothetical protein
MPGERPLSYSTDGRFPLICTIEKASPRISEMSWRLLAGGGRILAYHLFITYEAQKTQRTFVLVKISHAYHRRLSSIFL